MKIQTEYQTNIDYQRTNERVAEVFPTEPNTKGILTIYIGSASANISPNRIVQITCSNSEEKREILTVLKPLLVPSSGKLQMKPYKAHFHTDWPPPPSFEFSACSPKCYCTCENQDEMRRELREKFEKLKKAGVWGSKQIG